MNPRDILGSVLDRRRRSNGFERLETPLRGTRRVRNLQIAEARSNPIQAPIELTNFSSRNNSGTANHPEYSTDKKSQSQSSLFPDDDFQVYNPVTEVLPDLGDDDALPFSLNEVRLALRGDSSENGESDMASGDGVRVRPHATRNFYQSMSNVFYTRCCCNIECFVERHKISCRYTKMVVVL